MFKTRGGGGVDLDEIVALTIRPQRRPDPADDQTNANDRRQAAREIADWTHFPFEVMVETDERGELYLYGVKARDLMQAFYAGLTPWMRRGNE